MLSEIKVYSIKVMKTIKFLLFFKKKETVEYLLTYRIDEDRFWYYKHENGKNSEDHLMKQNLSNSISTMNGIKDRYENFNNFLKDKCEIEIFSLYDINPTMYHIIDSYSDKKEDMYNKKNRNGFLLNTDITEF